MIIDPCLSRILPFTTAPFTCVSFAAFRLTSQVYVGAAGALSAAVGMSRTRCEWRETYAAQSKTWRTCPWRSFDSWACLRDTDGMLMQMSEVLALASAHEYISPRRPAA